MRKWLRDKALLLRRETGALWLAIRDPRTPLGAKILAALVVGYALSPIDLIPDFVPVLGQLDDLILVPLGIYLAIRLIPAKLMAELREESERRAATLPRNYMAMVAVIALWCIAAIFAARFLIGLYGSSSISQ